MSLWSFFHKKKGVSPIVGTLFLFAVIIGAIAVSLGIVYPNVQRLSDQIELETSGVSLITLDQDLENLIRLGENSKLITEIETGQTGALQLDLTSTSRIQVYDGAVLVTAFSQNISHNRIQIVQRINRDVLAPRSYKYLSGGSQQNQIFLNESSKNTIQWEIINQSRPTVTDTVYTSLSYRNLVESVTSLDFSLPSVNLTIEFNVMNFTIPTGGSVFEGNPDKIEIRYMGPTVKSTNFLLFNDDLSIEGLTTLSDPGSTTSREHIYSQEAPVESSVSFYVQLKFTFYQFQVIL